MRIRSIFHLVSLLIYLLISISCSRINSSTLNLDFEQISSQTSSPVAWIYDNNSNYRILLDPNESKEGRHSLKIENIKSKSTTMMGSSALLRISNDKEITRVVLKGYIKTEGTNTDSSGLFITTDDMSDYVLSKDKNLIGTNDWQEYSVELQLGNGTENIFIGAVLFGRGKIWVDDLELEINGITVGRIPNQGYKASRKELNWLKENCIELKTVHSENGFDDLEQLRQAIGDARIVALGENTHGSSEVFSMKHRLVEFLATEMDFTIFSIEANMPEANELNDYVLHGQGSPSDLLEEMHMWTWNTEEVLKMIIWMKNFNQSGNGKIEFSGFDMQNCNLAIENIRQFANNYDSTLGLMIDTISSLSKKSKPGLYQKEEIESSLSLLEKSTSVYDYLLTQKPSIISYIDENQYNWLIQNAKILVQFSRLTVNQDYNFRDLSMAENINWILENNPDRKIVLWAHDGHISRREGAMGQHLAEKYGQNYYNIGFISNSGSFTALPTLNSGIPNSNNVLTEGQPGSFEYSFHRTGIPLFFLDLDQISTNESASLWLTKKLDRRSIGAAVIENMEFSSSNISQEFNAVIYIDSTHATHCFSIY